MGKSRRNRGKGASRSEPFAKTVKPPSDPQLAALREKKVLPVLKDLQSPESKKRTAAAAAISNIIEDGKCRKLLLREQIVHVVTTETITDSSLESRAAGWQILRFLAEKEEADFSVHLYRIDILTAIEHALVKVTEALLSAGSPFNKLPGAHKAFTWNETASLVFILESLIGAQEEIVGTLMKHRQIPKSLLSILANEATPEEISSEIAHFLMDLADDNQELAEVMLSYEDGRYFQFVMKSLQLRNTRVAVSCGLLHNTFTSMKWHDQKRGPSNSSDALLVPPLSKILEMVPSNASRTMGDLASGDQAVLSLEVLANICTSLVKSLKGTPGKGAEEPEWNGFDDDEGMQDADGHEDINHEAEMNDDEMESNPKDESDIDAEDMDMVTGADDDDSSAGIEDLPTLRELLYKAIPQLIRLSQVPADGEEGQAMRDHVYAVLSNLSWTISCLDFSDPRNKGIQKAWSPIATNVWHETVSPVLASGTVDMSLARRVTNLGWAVATSVQGLVPLAEFEWRAFTTLYETASQADTEAEDPFLTPGVSCIGVLGRLALGPVSPVAIREISEFLLSVLSSLPRSPSAEVVEAISQFFDIYRDERQPCERIFWEDKFLELLEGTQPKVRTMAKSIDKRTWPELRFRADEALLNLGRLIQYKKKNKPGE